jgi:integrase
MARRATGQIIEPANRRAWAIRFYAYGKRRFVTLGHDWTRESAEAELRHVLADVERGIWRPYEPEPVEAPSETPTFHEFASEWYAGVNAELRERTQVDYEWRLSSHLLPYFATYRLDAITVEEVDRYRRAKVRERDALRVARAEQEAVPADKRRRLPRPLSDSSINKMIRLLAAILEQAVEYGYLPRNPARGRKRLLAESRPSRSYLQPEQVAALLEAAGELDSEARAGDAGRRRPLLATLTLAGLRIGEALSLRWQGVNLADRKVRVAASKTDAGVRTVDLTPTLAELLSEYRARTHHGADADWVFPTAAGRRDNPSNVRTRFLSAAVERANERLADAGQQRMVAVTPHSLRRTCISLLLAAGADVPYVMAQVGHNDPKTTLGVYAQVIASKTDHGAALDGLVGATDWAATGSERPIAEPGPAEPQTA